MNYKTDLINLEKYIEEVSRLLPYSVSEKQPVLDDLRSDLQESLNSDPKTDIFNEYGSPREAAKNMSKSQNWKTKPAGWLIRILAFIVDFIILAIFVFSIILIGFFAVLNNVTDIVNTDRLELVEFLFLFSLLMLIGLLPITIMSLYFIVLEKKWSTTIGKWLFRLRTVDISGIKPSWKQALIRNFTKIQGEFLPFDIIIGMMMEKEKGTPGKYQRATDILAETMVVKKY